MQETSISRMALWTAYFRAFHAQYASSKVFDDFLAARIVDGLITQQLANTRGLAKMLMMSEAERASLEPHMRQALAALDRVGPSHLRPFASDDAAFAWIMKVMVPSSLVLSRARYAEDRLSDALARGVRQYVILGAGLDTFAFRRPEILNRLRVFEVDHPSTQSGKRRRLFELGWKEPNELRFVPVDLAKESLGTALTRSGFDSRVPAFFSWLGVTFYLKRDTVLATMRSIADIAPAGSELVFDYFETDAFVPEKQALRVHFTIREGERVGEPLTGGFNPATLAADLVSAGLRLVEDLDPSEIQRRWFNGRADGYYAFEQAHLACATA